MYDMSRQLHRSRRGFTLVELLITIGIIGTLATIVIVAINPNKQYSSTHDAERKSNVKQLQNALYQYLIDNGSLPTGIPNGTANAKPICKQGSTDATCVDLNAGVLPLIPKYLVAVPQDSAEKNALWSGYAVNANAGRAEVTAMYMGGTIITNGLLLWWKLDEAAGGAATDSSGNGHDGTLMNTPVWAAGKWGGGLTLNGSNQYVKASSISLPASATISVWAKTTSIATSPMLFVLGPSLTGPNIIFFQPTSTMYWNTWDGTNNPLGPVPSTVTNGTFHHYVIVNDSSANTTFYYDGVPMGSAAYRALNGQVWLGGNTVPYLWQGTVDDLRIYNRVLSPSEISQIAAGNG